MVIDMGWTCYRKELYHHGVKGQQWGVRNGPPYPIEHKTMKKGTILRSVSDKYVSGSAYKKANRPIYTYNPNDKWDSSVYKGPFSAFLIMGRGAQFIAEHEFEVARDLKMPNSKERMDEFKNLYNDKKFNRKVVKELSKYQKGMIERKVGNYETFDKIDINKLSTEEDYKIAYEIFNHAMEAAHLNKSTKEYMKRMSNKYDAMVDDNNQGIYNDAHDLVIIFKTNDLIERNKGVPISFLTMEEIKENYKKVESELSKKGKNVFL